MKTYNEYINESINWNNILIYSSGWGDLNGVKQAIQNGADIHTNDDYSLRLASENGHLNVVKYLVENGADIHINDDASLRWTIKYGHLDIAKYLISVYIEKKKFKELLNHFDILPEKIKEELKLNYPHIFAARDHGLI